MAHDVTSWQQDMVVVAHNRKSYAVCSVVSPITNNIQ